MCLLEATQSQFIFYYPFNYRKHHFKKFLRVLKENDYYHFQVEQQQFHEKFYGPDVNVSYELLKQYYYPFIEEKILNDDISLVNFNRFTKQFDLEGDMTTVFENMSFSIPSVDINLCPFGIGILAIRVQLKGICDMTSALSFAHYFRVLHPKMEEELGAKIRLEQLEYKHTEELVFKTLAPFLESFFVDYSHIDQTIKKMPYFEDERMYVSALIHLEEDTNIDDKMLYRAGQLNGRDKDGEPYISSTNEQYIKKFVEEHCYNRWAPNFYSMTTLQGHIQLTTYPHNQAEKYVSLFHTTSYYTTLIYYFYKLMLLKLAFEHSELRFSKDKHIIEDLIEQITKFASRYYFSEVSVRTGGKEIAHFFRKVFCIEEQYRDIKETLDELYRIQEDRSNDRLNELIFLLTVFTMISGIYGMNLVIDLLGEPMDWSSIFSFTLFEWIAFILTIVGLVISILLVINQLLNYLGNYFVKKKRRKNQ